MKETEIRRESFSPKQYLQEYFLEVDEEFDHLYRFWVNVVKNLPYGGRALELGVGPSIYSSIPLAAKLDEIHFADLVDSNLIEIDAWLKHRADCFNWRSHIKYIIGLEGFPQNEIEIDKREKNLRDKIKSLRHCDLRWKNPLGEPEEFDLVTAHFCIEAAARNVQEWIEIVKNIGDMVTRGGFFLLSVACGLSITRAYEGIPVDNKPPNINSKIIQDALTSAGLQLQYWDFVPAMDGDPYEGSILSLGLKPLELISEDILIDKNYRIPFLSYKNSILDNAHDINTEKIIEDELKKYPYLTLNKCSDNWCVIAKSVIPNNESIIQIIGEFVSTPSRYTLQIGENLHIGGNEMHLDDFLDHSCNPNCKIEIQNEKIFLKSIRQIESGEKLTFNYLTTEWDMAEPFECNCGEKNCFKFIKGFRYLSQYQKNNLVPLLTPFLKQKLRQNL